MKHASIVPLIGGMSLASDEVFGETPTALFSYEPFAENDSHLINRYKQIGADVPYYVIGKNDIPRGLLGTGLIDSVDSTCPCAGLSALSLVSSADSSINEWMLTAAEFVLGDVKPRVYWGENAPALAQDKGRPILDKLNHIGRKHGYSLATYLTRSSLHGQPQVRTRAFYFFWKGDQVPLLGWHRKPSRRIEDVMLEVRSNYQNEPFNRSKPSEEPFYRYLLEVIHGGITHRQYMETYARDLPVRENDAKYLIETAPGDHNYLKVRDWMLSKGLTSSAEQCERFHKKLTTGLNIMRRSTIVPSGLIGAFISYYLRSLAHPREDRYVTYREAMHIMGLPSDFELLEPHKNLNHVCQNVPLPTARDMAAQVHKALAEPSKFDWVKNVSLVQQNNLNMSNDIERKQSSLSAFF